MASSIVTTRIVSTTIADDSTRRALPVGASSFWGVHSEYLLETRLGGRSFKTSKRFSEFSALRDLLTAFDDPGDSGSWLLTVPFPAKKFAASCEPETVAERRVCLELWLSAVLKSALHVDQVATVLAFLAVDGAPAPGSSAASPAGPSPEAAAAAEAARHPFAAGAGTPRSAKTSPAVSSPGGVSTDGASSADERRSASASPGEGSAGAARPQDAAPPSHKSKYVRRQSLQASQEENAQLQERLRRLEAAMEEKSEECRGLRKQTWSHGDKHRHAARLARLKQGIVVQKFASTSDKTSTVRMRLSEEGDRVLYSDLSKGGLAKTVLRASEVKVREITSVEFGCNTRKFRAMHAASLRSNGQEWLAFTVSLTGRPYNFVAQNESDAFQWVLGIQSLMVRATAQSSVTYGSLLWRRTDMKIQWTARRGGTTADKVWSEAFLRAAEQNDEEEQEEGQGATADGAGSDAAAPEEPADAAPLT